MTGQVAAKIMRQMAVLLLISSLFLQADLVLAYQGVYSGIEQHQEIYYSDVAAMGANYWATEAVYQLSAFGLLQGFGEGRFAPLENVTKAQALAILYRACNREEQAELMAAEIDKTRNKYPDSVSSAKEWSDGYIALALNDGLLTMAQYKDAFSISPNSFYKNEAVTRQEVAYWIAAVFKISPSYNHSFNGSYADWDTIDLEYLPYLNALINEKIMVGSDNRIYPTGALTRAEMAQILLNCESYFIHSLHITAKSDTILNIPSKNVIEIGENVLVLDMKLEEGMTVIADGSLASFSLLKPNDLITYYINSDNRVFFAKTYTPKTTVITDSYITSGIIQRINGNKITLYDESGKTDHSLLRDFAISSRVTVSSNNGFASLSDLKALDMVFLKVSGGYVTEISFSKETASGADIGAVPYVDKVYKAELDSLDPLAKSIFVKDVMELDSTSWEYTRHKGVLELKLDTGTKLYYGNKAISINNIGQYRGYEIMAAIAPHTDSKEKVVFLRISETGNGTVYQGKITNILPDSRKVQLSQISREFSVDAGTILVKDGQLVSLNYLSKSDQVSLAGKTSGTQYQAYVMVVDSDFKTDAIQAYHARVEDVSNGNRLTVTTVRGYDPKERSVYYSKRTMTVSLTNNTRYYDRYGIVNNRDFNLWSNDGAYIYVNLVVKDGEAVAISLDDTAYDVLVAKVGSVIKTGTVTEGFNLYRVWSYASGKHVGTMENGPIYIAKNTIFLKNGKPVQPSELKVGDTITAFYDYNYEDGQGEEMLRAMLITFN